MNPQTILEQRNRVLKEAMTWLNTPFHHDAMVKRVGVDCSHIGETYRAALGVSFKIPSGINPQWHLHEIIDKQGNRIEDEMYIRGILEAGFVEIQCPPEPADVVMSQIGRRYCHAGIVITWPHKIIQAESIPMGAGKVIVANSHANIFLTHREMKFFSRKEWHDGIL